MTATLHIQLLGDFRLMDDDAPISGANTPRLQSLLAYLLLHRDAAQPRGHVAFRFWPDSTEAQARTNLRTLLHRLRRSLPEPDCFLQVDALPRYYATAGAFIHASTTEQWGLVVNEAMASGLPVAVSNRCGSTHFLIEDGVTGFSFDPFRTEEITRALTELAALPDDTPLVAAAAKKVDEVSPEQFGKGLNGAAKAALANPARPGFLARRTLDLAIARAARNERA